MIEIGLTDVSVTGSAMVFLCSGRFDVEAVERFPRLFSSAFPATDPTTLAGAPDVPVIE
jgi:hypothetical protein